MGVEILRGTLFGLPGEDSVAILDFPIQAWDTIFSYMMLDWNAHGHEPAPPDHRGLSIARSCRERVLLSVMPERRGREATRVQEGEEDCAF